VRRRGREHAEPGAGQLGLRPRGVRPSEGEGGGRAACFQLGQRGEEERGRFFLFLLFIFFFLFQSLFKAASNQFENIFTLLKITQYNENKCSKMNAQTNC
jgi:hypothetical protein